MKLNELSDEQLLELIDNAKNGMVISDLLRDVMSDFFSKPKDQVKLTDLVVFGWDVATVLADRMNFYKRAGEDATSRYLP